MPRTQTAIGIDIGAHALKAVVVRKSGPHVALVRAGSIEFGDLAFIEDSERKDRRVAELLRLLLRQCRMRRRRVAAGLAGHDYFLKYMHVPPAPPEKLRKLIEYEVSEGPTGEVREQTTDFWLLDLPTKAEEFTVLVAMARNETLRRRIALLKRAGVSTEGLTLDAVALFNAYVHTMGEAIYNDKTALLVDIGGSHMDVVVQRNAKLLFIRNLTLGGERFSEAVQEEFELPIKEAEELKLSQGAILPRHFDIAEEIDTSTPEARLSAALLEPAENIYGTLQATIRYCQAQTRMTDLRVDEVVLCGRGSRLRGLREFLAQRFRAPVQILDPFQNIDTSALPPGYREDVIDEAPSYTVAIGLALRQLEERRIRPITLLPDEVRRRQAFFARDAYLYAAAAVFGLAFGAMIYSSKVATSTASEQLRAESRLVESATTRVEDFQLHVKRNTILAGQAEALKRLLDTGRRCAEAIAVLKKEVPPQLRIDRISTVTERATPKKRRRPGAPGQEPRLTTHLVIEGRVAEKFEGQEITLAAAQNIVDNFLASLQEQSDLYSSAKVTKYPTPKEPATHRTFRMVVYFAAPFYGGGPEVVRR